MKEDNQFALVRLNFTAIKTIKDSCRLFAQQGSKHAAKLADALEQQMGQIEV